MAIPGHEFVRAHFSNNERTTVESFWTDGKVERVEYIEAKDGDPNWENLLTHINIDDLHEATYKHIREQNDIFEDSIIKIAKERGMIHDLNEIQNQSIHKLIIDTIFGAFDEEKDKERLFLYKLKLFELEKIKKSKKDSLKKKLRQAKTVIEATEIAIKLVS